MIYAGPAGDPALGPPAFPHRPSAFPNPIAPITHHWLDATHISFGVVTAGLYTSRWKIEASAFNRREPDDARMDLDLAPLDSFAGRFSLAPTPRLTMQYQQHTCIRRNRGWDLHAHEFIRLIFLVGKVQGGYIRHFRPWKGLLPGIGGSLSATMVPPLLAPRYAGRIAPGFGVFINVRPIESAAAHQHSVP